MGSISVSQHQPRTLQMPLPSGLYGRDSKGVEGLRQRKEEVDHADSLVGVKATCSCINSSWVPPIAATKQGLQPAEEPYNYEEGGLCSLFVSGDTLGEGLCLCRPGIALLQKSKDPEFSPS